MSNEPDNPVRADDSDRKADAIPADSHAQDPLREVLKLRRWVRVSVYTAILSSEPFYFFVMAFSPAQLLAGLLVGFVIAFAAIEGAFNQMIKLRKRSAYPNLLLVEIGNVAETAQAAQRGAEVAARLTHVTAAIIGIVAPGGRLRLAASTGLPTDQADEILLRSRDVADAAMAGQQPVSVRLATAEPFHEAFGLVPNGVDRIVFVPVIALNNPIGVIVLAGQSRRADVKDDQLLAGIGVALGLSIENLRQRDELRAGQERLERVITGAPLVLFALDRDGAYTLIEGKGLEVLGTRPEQVLGRSIFDVFTGRSEITDAAKRALEGEEVIASADFSGATFEARLTPVRDASGQVSGVIGVATDISERRLAEEALRASEERLSTTVSNVPVVLFAIDRDGVFTLSEGKGLADLGLKAGQVVGMNIHDLYRDSPAILANVDRALKGEAVTDTVEVAGLYWETIYSPIRDATGAVVSVIGVASNVTDRLRAAEAVRESEEVYRTLVETSPDAVLLTTATGEIIKANGPAAALLGFEDASEMTGCSAVEFVDEPDRERLIEDIRSGFSNGVIRNIEYLLRQKGGAQVPVEISLSAIAGPNGVPKAFVAVARDATERRKAEERLIASERRFRTLIESSTDAIALLGADGEFTYVGPSTQSVLGYEPEEMIGRHVTDLIHAEDLTRAEDGLRNVMAGAKTFVEVRVKHRDGSWLWIEGVATNMLDDPHIGGIVLNYRDATDRRRAEQALRDSEERTRLVLENALDAIVGMDMHGDVINWNPQAEAVFGWTREEAIGRQLAELIIPERDRKAHNRGLKGHFKSGRHAILNRRIEVMALHKDGHEFPIELAVSASPGPAGVAFNGFIRDITERRRAEEAVRDSEEKYRDMVENSNEIIYTLDAAGVITYISPAVMQLGGYEPEEIVGRTSLSFVHPDDLPELAASFRRTIGGTPEPSEYRLRAKSGDYVWVQTSSKPIYDGDRIVGLRGLIVDINKRKRAEEALSESEDRYRELFESASDLVYTHDLEGNYLSVNKAVEQITGYTREETLKMKWADVIAEDHRPRLAEIAAALAAGSGSKSFEIDVISKDGRRVPLEVRPQVVFRDGQPVAIRGIARDIAERKRVHATLTGEKRVLEMIARGAALSEVLELLVRIVEDQSEGMVGSVLLLDPSGGSLHLGAAPSLPEAYNRAADGIPIGPSVGSCGTAAYRKELVVVSDINTDPLWADAREVALAAGLQACWSMPIFSTKGEVLGTFAMYYGSPREPGKDDVELIEKATHIAGIAIEREQAEHALQASEERYRNLVNTSPDVIYTLGLDASLTSLNPAFETVTGWKREDWLGKHFAPLVHPDDLETAVDLFRRVLEGETPTYELRIKKPSGEFLVGEFTSTPLIEDGKQIGTFGIARDVTERKKAEAMIRELAYHDALTGLPNRALFEDRLGVALAQAHRRHHMLAVMFLDLDRFKVVNDTIGHSGGDKLLKGVAEDLKAIVREGDTVARVGGDEFTLLLPGIESPDDATDVARRILDVLRGTRVIDGQEFAVSTSIGITLYPQDGADTDTLLRNADTAMYRAKERGRDNFQLYTPAMNAGILQRLSLESDLRHALERNELRVYYQPISETATGRIVATEALVRWEHPERGVVEPDAFIPFAEESGLIVPMGEWVLREAMRQNQVWQESGHRGLRVGVNLSARQLQQEDMVATVSRLLRETGLAPELLQLEITEGAVMKNVELIIAMLHQIRRMNIGISLDDFGTGYSSLSYLKRFPIDSVKVDRSFVRDIATDPNDAAIVTTVIAMARSLNLQVIAEGVETAEQLDFLRQHGCGQFQGYLVSPPAPPDVITCLLEPAGRRAKITRLRSA